MAHLSIAHTSVSLGDRWFGALASGFAHTQDFLSMVGAAVRVARAVEVNAAPDARDMATLGITGKLPRLR